MSFEFTCPHCGKKLEAEAEWIGSKGQCPSCNHEITINLPQDNINNSTDDNKPLSRQKEFSNNFSSNVKKSKRTEYTNNNNSTRIYKLIISICILLIIVLCILYFKPHYHILSNFHSKTEKNIPNEPLITDKKDYSININCYFWNNYNEKKIPACHIVLWSPNQEAEDTFKYLQEDLITIASLEEKKKLIAEGDDHPSTKKTKMDIIDIEIHGYGVLRRDILVEGYYKMLKTKTAIKDDFIREGKIVWEHIQPGDYTLFAISEYGIQTFLWVRHIKIHNQSINIDLTNDQTCYIFEKSK